MTPQQRSERKTALVARITSQRQQLAAAGQDWLGATQGLDEGWQCLLRYRYLALTGGAVLLGWGLLRRRTLAHLCRRHSPALLNLGSWLLTRR